MTEVDDARSPKTASTLSAGSSGNNSWVTSETRGTSAASYCFKTIYFPAERVHAGTPRRITISLPHTAGEIVKLSSAEIRSQLGDPYVEDLEAIATTEGRSLSNVCHRLLTARHLSPGSQLQLPLVSEATPQKLGLGLTFQDSKQLSVHRWYPYVEGFSANYVNEIIDRYGPAELVYDPFGGAGTTMVAAAHRGIRSIYSEVNPFMCFVASTKTQAAAWCRRHIRATQSAFGEYLGRIAAELPERSAVADITSYELAFPERDFFEEKHLRDLLAARDLVADCTDSPAIADVLLLACAANAVHASNMTRRADLRRRRPDEYRTRVVDVAAMVSETVQRILCDINSLPAEIASSERVSEDCRQLSDELRATVDLAVTSPPYLNGTNYFRNTKIELWLVGFIKSEDELAAFRARAVAAGINNVNKQRRPPRSFPYVEAVVDALEARPGDRRIPQLLRHYFSDMAEAMESVYRVLKPGGRFVLDIGDSQYYGVHIPTDQFLVDVGREQGFIVDATRVLARRHSRDKSPLVQREIVYRKPSAVRRHR